MTIFDLYFFACLLAPIMWVSAPMSEKRTYRADKRRPGRQTTRRAKADKPKKTKRTKAKKQKRYKAPPLSVEQQSLDTRYLLGRDFKTYTQ